MNSQQNSRKFIVIVTVMLILAAVYLVKLFSLQVVSKDYAEAAKNNALRQITEHPDRGLIYDRNDSLLVFNDAAYDLMVVPKELRTFDTLDLCRILDITKEELEVRIEKASAYSKIIPSLFAQQMSKEDYGYLQEKMFKFPGFFVQTRTLRSYPEAVAAHILGYVGEVSEQTMEDDPYYKMGDYIGISGIEKAYEAELRGVKGQRVVLVDVNNREIGSYHNGEEDVKAVPGTPLWSTLDLRLQRYGEQLMQNKRGSIVAIEPKTGEILCIVSSPGYDPNLLVGKDRSKNYRMLLMDSIRKPLFNRALQAMYPPGSTFKLANGLIAQEEGVLTANTIYPCPGGYQVGSHKIGCHHGGPTNLMSAVQHSCNTYFCKAFYNVISNKSKYKTIQQGYTAWRDRIMKLGFGTTFDTDLPYEKKGILPSADYFDRVYLGHWNGNSVVSMGIGQGEVCVTPIQMANMLAIIANRGYYVRPHVIKAIGTKDHLNTQYMDKVNVDIKPQYFDPIIEGMELAATAGTARGAQIEGIRVAGKTGTAQNPHGRDHSVFALIAPVDDPQIVVFCLVENGGWGASVACPIASLIAELYLTGEVKRTAVEENMLNLSLK